MADNRTTFQKLTDVVIGAANGYDRSSASNSVVYNVQPSSKVLFATDDKEERDTRLKQLKQQRYMAYQWKKTGYETSMEQMAGASQVKVMYRDADLMSAWPEIGAALHTIAEEATTIKKGKILNIYSKSERVQAVLEDLFINRLDFNVWCKTIAFATAKYGNEYMLLNIDDKNGVTGWREMPVHEMTRLENGMQNAYAGTYTFSANAENLKPGETKFVWEGHNSQMNFKNWMVAHFRLVNDSIYLPYGCSWLNSSRRHWRILSMMEDAMLLYRLERSVERRIFKVNVGLIDDADVPAFLQEFMNTVKRAPIIDPKTGQMDLRKNFLDVSADYVIPVRPGQDPTSIETLSAAQNPTSMDDINYIEGKVLCGLRVPKTYLNFQEPQGRGQNLSLLDIRFSRAINGLQQAILLELNKVAIIHLYLLGFTDELTNFTLSLNNPSNQIEMMELDNLVKKLSAASTALSQQGGGLPLMSWHGVQKKIMGLTDKEIADLLDEIRLETAVAIEIQRTPEIIKQTHLFDRVDRIYGEPGAKYSDNPQGQGGEGGLDFGGGGGGGMPPMGGGFGDELGDLGEPGADTSGDIGGETGEANLGDLGGGEAPAGGAPEPLAESRVSDSYSAYIERLKKQTNEITNERVKLLDKNFIINEELNSAIKSLEEMSKNSSKDDEIVF
jgi:hypothetical protein